MPLKILIVNDKSEASVRDHYDAHMIIKRTDSGFEVTKHRAEADFKDFTFDGAIEPLVEWAEEHKQVLISLNSFEEGD